MCNGMADRKSDRVRTEARRGVAIVKPPTFRAAYRRPKPEYSPRLSGENNVMMIWCGLIGRVWPGRGWTRPTLHTCQTEDGPILACSIL